MPSSSAKPRVDSVLRSVRDCPEKYLVTLTTRQPHDPLTLSKAVSEWQHRLNKKLFGMAYVRRGTRMATYAVQELNFNQGMHTHLLVGLPEGALEQRANRPTLPFQILAIETWCALNHGRARKGQDVRPITDFMGAYRYVHKTISNLNAVDHIDVMNLHIPNVA